MSDWKITKKYFIGDSTINKWSSVYHYRPQSPDVFTNKGEVYAIISVFSQDEKFNASIAGNLLLDAFHETYFESKKKGVLAALSTAISSTQERLTQLLAHEDEASEVGVDFDLTAMSLRDNEVYFAALGSHKIFLLPYGDSEEVQDITKVLQDPYGKDTVRLGSSFLQSDQRYLLLTDAVAQTISMPEIKQSLVAFNDNVLKGFSYEKSEEVATFMVGVNLDPQQILSANTPAIDVPEQSDQEATTVESLAEPQSDALAESEVEPEVETLAEEVIRNEEIPVDELEEIDTNPPTTNVIKTIKHKITQLFSSISQRRKDRRENAELRRLQHTRANGYTSVDTNSSTFRVLVGRVKRKIVGIKDVILYDFLQVNGGKLNRNSPGFKIMVLLGVVLGIIAIYAIISAAGAARDRDNRVRKANDTLVYIKSEIDRLEASPTLNVKSFADLSQRQALLTETQTLQTKFTKDFELLPTDAVEAQRARLSTLQSKILRQRVPEFALLFDAGNLFQGKITDFAVSGANVYVLDGPNGRIYRQPIAGGNGELLIDGLVQPTSIVADSNGQLIVYDNYQSSVLAIINPATKAVSRVAGVSSTQMPNVTQLAIYTNTNGLYSISSDTNKVKTLKRSGSTYGLPTNRYTQEDGTAIRDIQVSDGRILLLVEGVGLVRIEVSDSRIEAFESVLEGIKTATVMGVDEEYIYIVNNLNKRMYVLSKQRSATAISDLVADLDISKLNDNVSEVGGDKSKGLVFVSTGTKVYTFGRSSLTN